MALSERDRRTVTIGGIGVGVLLAGFLLFSVLGGGEEEFPPFPDARPATSSPSSVAGRGRPPIQSFTGRDPFSVPPALSPSPVAHGTGASPRRRDALAVNGGRATGTTPSPTAPGQRLEPERRRVHRRPARHLPARRRDARAGGGRRHRLRRRYRGAVRERAVRAALGRGQLRDVPVRRRAVHPLHQPAEIGPGDPPTGGAVAGAGAALAPPPHLCRVASSRPPAPGRRWGPLRCCRAQDAHRRGVPREGARGRPRGDPGGRARGAEGDRRRARPATPRARPRRAAEARDRRARHPERHPSRTDPRLADRDHDPEQRVGAEVPRTSWRSRERATRPSG